jgi:tripartite-type tricarboxylate transporter receptor subunit TctC
MAAGASADDDRGLRRRGGTDVAARTVARFMEKDLGQPVVVLNRPAPAARSAFPSWPAPGRTGSQSASSTRPPSSPADRAPHPLPAGGFLPRRQHRGRPGRHLGARRFAIRDIAGPAGRRRAEPERIGYGTTGVGSDDHLAMLALERATGLRFLHVPFGGSAQVKQNLISRSIPVAVMNVAEGRGGDAPGHAAAAGADGARRAGRRCPRCRPLRELGFDVVEGSMRGIAAPAGCRRRCWSASPFVRRTVADPISRPAPRSRTCRCVFSHRAAFLDELEALRRHYQALWQQHPWREG